MLFCSVSGSSDTSGEGSKRQQLKGGEKVRYGPPPGSTQPLALYRFRVPKLWGPGVPGAVLKLAGKVFPEVVSLRASTLMPLFAKSLCAPYSEFCFL